MKKTIFFLLLFSLSSFLDAREEIILTLPKAGTHYLSKILENLTDCYIIPPTSPYAYKKAYTQYKARRESIVMGHCEPLIVDILPKEAPILLLIRDPRDIVLSAVDYIDTKGLSVWPGLPQIISPKQWIELSKEEKISIILDAYYDNRRFSIMNLLETAMYLCSHEQCLLIKYEELSPECNTCAALFSTLQNIAYFLNIPIDEIKAKEVIEKSFRNQTSTTLNQGRAFRYLHEDREIVEFLESKLKKYIEFFNFDYKGLD